MLFQTSTTIILISSALTFLIKNIFCADQQTDDQNNSEFQVTNSENPQSVQLEESKQSVKIKELKMFIQAGIKELKIKTIANFAETNLKNYEDHKKAGDLTKEEEAIYKFLLIFNEINFSKTRDMFKLARNFNKENLEKFSKHVEDSTKKINKFKSEYSYLFTDEEKKSF